MIRHFEPIHCLEPEGGNRFQILPALGAGLIAGVLLLIIPRGSPWSGLTFFSAVIMGRPVPAGESIPLALVCLIHLGLAEVYALTISIFLGEVTQGRAIIVGAVIGLVLYLINLAVVSLSFPAWSGNEPGALFTHVVFGLIVGGAYRGLLKRSPKSVTS